MSERITVQGAPGRGFLAPGDHELVIEWRDADYGASGSRYGLRTHSGDVHELTVVLSDAQLASLAEAVRQRMAEQGREPEL